MCDKGGVGLPVYAEIVSILLRRDALLSQESPTSTRESSSFISPLG